MAVHTLPKMDFTAEPLWMPHDFSASPSRKKRNAGARGGVAAVAAVFDTVVVPGGVLLLYNIAIYTGLTSFSLRPDQDRRLLPIMTLVFSGVAFGAVVFPRLLAWAAGAAGAAGRGIGRAAVAVYLLLAIVAVAPGFTQYAFNEPLRYAANFFLGMVIPPAHLLYFSRFAGRKRGLWFGFCTGAGLLCWRILMSVAARWPHDGAAGAHPFLPHVFTIHCAAIALLAVLSLYALVVRSDNPAVAAESYFTAAHGGGGKRTAVLLLSAAFVLYLMNGVLDVRLFPMMPVLPQPSLEHLLYALVIVCSPLAGWFLDRSPETVFRRVMPVCCWLFILSPAMAALGIGGGLHDILQTVAAAGQFVIYVVITLALTGLARDGVQAGFFASVMYAMWMVPVLGYSLLRRELGLDTGATVLIATGLAFLFFLLIKRVDFAVAEPASASDPESAPDAVPSVAEARAVTLDKFLDSAGLTPREREAAVLLLQDVSTIGIANTMGISESTAKKHIQGVLRKFGAANRYAFVLQCATAAARAYGDPE